MNARIPARARLNSVRSTIVQTLSATPEAIKIDEAWNIVTSEKDWIARAEAANKLAPRLEEQGRKHFFDRFATMVISESRLKLATLRQPAARKRHLANALSALHHLSVVPMEAVALLESMALDQKSVPTPKPT
jgi:hypothetical protein